MTVVACSARLVLCVFGVRAYVCSRVFTCRCADTRLLALTAVRCVVEAAGDALRGGDGGGWRPLLGVLGAAAVAGVCVTLTLSISVHVPITRRAGSDSGPAADRFAARDRGAIVPLAFQTVKVRVLVCACVCVCDAMPALLI